MRTLCADRGSCQNGSLTRNSTTSRREYLRVKQMQPTNIAPHPPPPLVTICNKISLPIDVTWCRRLKPAGQPPNPFMEAATMKSGQTTRPFSGKQPATSRPPSVRRCEGDDQILSHSISDRRPRSRRMVGTNHQSDFHMLAKHGPRVERRLLIVEGRSPSRRVGTTSAQD